MCALAWVASFCGFRRAGHGLRPRVRWLVSLAPDALDGLGTAFGHDSPRGGGRVDISRGTINAAARCLTLPPAAIRGSPAASPPRPPQLPQHFGRPAPSFRPPRHLSRPASAAVPPPPRPAPAHPAL